MANKTIKNIECVLFYSNVYEDEQLASILAKVGASQNFSAENLSNYSNLIGHTHHIFAASGYGFEKKYFSTNLEKMKKKDGTYSTRYARYCTNQSRKTDETLGGQRRLDICSLCEYSVAYANARVELEEKILFYQVKTGLPIKLPSRTIKTTKNIFHSCTLLCPDGTVGQYPLVGFNFLMFHALALPRNGLTEENFDSVLDELSLYIYNEAVSKVDAFSGFPNEFFDTARLGVRVKVKTFLKSALASTVTDTDLENAIALCAMPYSTYRKKASAGSTDEEILKSLEDKKKDVSEKAAMRRAPLPGSIAPAISTRSASIPATPLITDAPETKKSETKKPSGKVPEKKSDVEIHSKPKMKPEKKNQPGKKGSKKVSSIETKELTMEIEGIISNMGALGDAPVSIDIVEEQPHLDVKAPCVSGANEEDREFSGGDLPVDVPEDFCPNIGIEVPSDEELEENGAMESDTSSSETLSADGVVDVSCTPDTPDFSDIPDIAFSDDVPVEDEMDKPSLEEKTPPDSADVALSSEDDLKNSDGNPSVAKKKSKKKRTKKATNTNNEDSSGFSLNTYTVDSSEESPESFIQIPCVSPDNICSLDAENAAGVAALSILLYKNMLVFMEYVSLNGTPGLLFYNDTASGDTPKYIFTSGFIGAIKDFLRCKERIILTSSAINLYYYFSLIGAECFATIHDLRLMNELSGKAGSRVMDMKSVIRDRINPKNNGDSEDSLLYCMRYYECLRGKLFGEDTTERMWENYYALLSMEKIIATYTPTSRLNTDCLKHSSCVYQIAPYTEHASGGLVGIKINVDDAHPLMIDNIPIYYHVCNSLCRARTFKSFYMDISTINKNGIVLHYNSLRVHDMYDALWCMVQKTCKDLYDSVPDIYISEVSTDKAS